MTEQFRMPDPGEGINEVRITEVHVKQGDQVADGETIFSIESDKAAVDVPAPFDGVVEDIRVSDGDAVNVGDVLLSYSPTDEDGSAEETEDAESTQENGASSAGPQEKSARPSSEKKHAERNDTEESRKKEASEDDTATGSRRGSQGEAAHADEGAQAEPASTRDASETEPAEESASADAPRAAPSTRRLARQLGVDLKNVEASGPAGRVLATDVEAVADQRARETQADEAKPKDRDSAAAQRPATERIPLNGIRKTTAQRMTEAWSSMPHVTHQDVVDITELERFRREHKHDVQGEGGKLTIMILVIKSLAAALRAFPRFNACLDSDKDEIVQKYRYHIGFAVATDDGLLVPVLRHADRKSAVDLAIEAADLAERARARDLRQSELRGGTFTVTNPGSIGGTAFTPIINPPQAAILGLGRARPDVVVDGDLDDYRSEPRLMLPLMLAFDHRLNDGADAARFVTHLAEMLADPEQIALRA